MTPHRITIDMKKSGYKQFVNIRQAENESHIIYVSLTNGTEPIKLDNDMVATVYLEGISKQWESCDIKDNEIVFTVPILNMGDTKCQIQLSNDNGYSISPTFIIVAENILNVPHFELLEEEPDDWVDNAENYYTFDGTDYVPVKYDNENRNIFKDIKFSQSPVLVTVPSDQAYKQTPNISVTEGKKIYLTPTNKKTTLSLYVSFYMWNDKGKGTPMGQTKLYTETKNIITVPTIPKRDKNINNYNRVYMYCAVTSTDLDTELHANIQAEYDEQTYFGCKTPYFEKGKYYAMVNDYGNVGNSYNALIQALQEARTYYNKAIKDVSMVDNCLVITYNDNTQYKSDNLKGDGIARLDKSTDGNVDTYTFVTDKGNTFSFTITNADNTKIDDLYTQLGYKTPLTVFNNEVAKLKKLINDLDIAKESVEEHNKSVSQLKNSLSVINTQLSILQSNKIDKDTYTTSIESLQALITKLQNSKVDTNTYSDEIANLTTAIAELKDKQIDTNAIKESITELDTKKLNKEEFNQYKENVANTFASAENEIKANKNSTDKLSTDLKSYKTSNDNAVNNKVDTTDFSSYKATTNKAIDDNTKSIKANATAIDKCTTNIANNSALINQNAIKVTTDKSTCVVLNDSSDCNIVNLFLYGNSTQSSVPTPTAQVNIDNVTNPKIKLYHKNLFDFSVCKVNTNDSATINSFDRDNCKIDFTTSETGASSGIYIGHSDLTAFNKGYGVDYTKLSGKSVTLSFDVQSDVACKIEVQLTKYSRSYFDIIPAKQRFSVTEVVDINKLNKALCFYTNKTKANITISNIQIEVNNTATDYENCNANQISVDCTLCKVNNIADTLTINTDGTGYITQNLLYEKITSDKSQYGNDWQYSTTSLRFYRDDTRYKANAGTPNILCSHFEVKDNEKDTTLDNTIGFTSSTGKGIAIRMLQFDGDLSAFKNWLDSNEVYVLVPLEKPIVTELSKEQVAEILSLRTYYPSTTVVSDCDSQLTYIADTKNYIDNKFNELATAIVAHESEVN